ncbi:ABC transporter ATP-binding protein [Flexilinea flocculi]|jgi:putative ABC transport system ATP-binding protein|uniref:ABC-type uncharacterized transport system, ATPase component n=1 Tax=Flexilinea flocculi TaxID=1678840 RepID=A0A0S7BR51_9CHLR|nr:ATP-binding cassette domain-containing protein [Flexilinea flocculi]NMB92918.1 ATP-binding cassette domain-containing protein [Flexilinea flocculi]GAP40126.1 ABC-type uncharacterized transport system, ATPase component [Flexilinea flocculi]
MLKVEKITKIFEPGTVSEKVALNQVDLVMNEGDFVTVIGGNGAGKSSLLNAIAGRFEVTSGSIFIDGTDLTRQPEYKRAQWIGRVFQDPMMGTAANMTIEENLSIALRRGKIRTLNWGIGKGEKEVYINHLAQLDLGLETRIKTKVGLLSGGQRQALTLLMATIKKPKLLLLDEHTAALDPSTGRKVLSLTDKLVKENRLTTLMVTHNMKDAIQYGNRIIMMDEGRIIADIPLEKKKNIQVEDLISLFEKTSRSGIANDRLLLA